MHIEDSATDIYQGEADALGATCFTTCARPALKCPKHKWLTKRRCRRCTDRQQKCREQGVSQCFLALDFVNDVADLKSRPQLEAHVLHHHITVQEQQCSAINLVSPKEVRVCGQSCIQAGYVPDHVLNAPLGRRGRGRWTRLGSRGAWHCSDGNPYGPLRPFGVMVCC